jgi:hypothetical protein
MYAKINQFLYKIESLPSVFSNHDSAKIDNKEVGCSTCIEYI